MKDRKEENMMDPNRWIWNGDTFVASLVASQLVDQKRAASLSEEFRQSGSSNLTITGFCDFLISKGVVTYWQCMKLRNDQYKGFFCGEYVIIDYLSSNNVSSLYVARHVKTGEVVVLVFDPPSTIYREVRPVPPCFN